MNVDWKIVFRMFLALQFGVPLLVSAKAFFIDGENYFSVLKEGMIITFFFLCLIFYLPLLFKWLRYKF